MNVRAPALVSIALWTAALLCLGCGLSGCGDGAGSSGDVLVVYSAGPRPLAEFACKQFTKQTGIETQLFSATTGQIMAKLEAEKYHPRADVVVLASRFAGEWLKRADRLRPYRPAFLTPETTHEHWHDPQSYYLATSAAAVGVAVRRDHDANDLDWSDFFDGRFQGGVVMPSPSRSGTAADFVLGYVLAHPDTAWTDLLNLRKHGAQIAGANSQAMTELLIGSRHAIFAAADYLVFKEIARGEPIVMRYPKSGVPMVERPIAIFRTTPHADAARKFVDFYFSRPVQTEIARLHLIPALRDVPLSPERQAAGAFKEMPIDIDQGMKQQQPVLRKFQYQIERAVVVQ